MQRAWVVAAAVFWLLVSPVLAGEPAAPRQESPPEREEEPTPAPEAGARHAEPQPASQVRYVPPRRGSPRTKIGAGVRGVATQPRPLALAPPHTAQSARSAPMLFWHIAAPMRTGARAVFALTRPDHIDPVAELELGRLLEAGIHRVDLAAHEIALEPGTEYQWSISIVVDRDGRGMDRIDRSQVVYVAARAPASTPADWAAQSFWHDALTSALAAFETDPTSPTARADLEALLLQGGLEVAIP